VTDHRLLTEFRKLFEGTKYLHRRSNLGDFVAMHLYEDLMAIKTSERYVVSVESMSRVLNTKNKATGIKGRRGDGTFGALIIGEKAEVYPGYKVARGPVANIEIGVEVKIIAKAMIKQIDRVKTDLGNQVVNFKVRAGSSRPICVGIVGINYADEMTSYEGDRPTSTDGKKNKHPIQEAEEARRRLVETAKLYDEFLILRFKARNRDPFEFEWVNERETRQEYTAALQRISFEYQHRF
jgi:hypothetical protein